MKTISSVIESVPIEMVEQNRQTILNHSFNKEEQMELKQRHIRSTAGVLAVKKALCALILQQTGSQFDEKDFYISRLTSGAPVLKQLPNQLNQSRIRKQDLFLSISHSRKTAYGLAVHQRNSE